MSRLNHLWPQWSAAFEVFLLSLLYGISIGWQTSFIGRLSRPNSPFEATEEDISWVASLENITRFLGIMFGTLVTCRRGIKHSVHTSGLFTSIGSIFLICASSIKSVFLHQIFNGVGMGIYAYTYPMYIGEIADPSIRGKLVTFSLQGTMTGSLIGSAIGVHLETSVYGIIRLAILLPFCITFYFFPPTPQYLVRCYRKEEAVKAIKWYNRNVDDSYARTEVERLSKSFIANPPLSIMDTIRKISTPVNRKILLLMITIFILEKLCGVLTIHVFLDVLLTASKITVTNPSHMVLVMNIVSIISSWIGIYFSDKFKRTTTILVGCTIIALAIFCWGIHYQLLDYGYSDPNLQWIALISCIIYHACVVVTVIPILNIMMSELFASDIKSMAVCIVNIFCSLSGFFANKYFQFMVDILSYEYVFYIFAVSTLMTGIYGKIFVPETKGKSLEEIQEILNREKHIEELEVLKVDKQDNI